MKPIIGQEAVCPHGLGRVSEVIDGICDTFAIRVDTYIRNRGCVWDSKNVKLVRIIGLSKEYQP